MAVTEGKRRKPPTFPYLHKSRAKRLERAWVEDRKIRSKWKAQKRREGLTNQTGAPVDIPSHPHDAHPDEPDTSPDRPDSPPIPTPSHDRQSLRDLRRRAYASKSPRTQKYDSGAVVHSSNDRNRKVTTGHKASPPNMKLRMNVLLEKIKRDFS